MRPLWTLRRLTLFGINIWVTPDIDKIIWLEFKPINFKKMFGFKDKSRSLYAF